MSNLESVRARLALAELSNPLTDEVYETERKALFKQELGIFRRRWLPQFYVEQLRSAVHFIAFDNLYAVLGFEKELTVK